MSLPASGDYIHSLVFVAASLSALFTWPLCVCVNSLCLSLIRTFVMTFRTHAGNLE